MLGLQVADKIVRIAIGKPMIRLAVRILPVFAIIIGFAMALAAYMNFSGVRTAYLELVQARMEMIAGAVATDVAAASSLGIALPEGYALIWLEEVIDKDAPPLEQVRDELARVVRLELERVRMQQLARVMISQANVVVLDPALDKAWQRQRETIAQP